MNRILHVGMHKTGTTAIQRSLADYCDASFEYAQLGNTNHSRIFTSAFVTDPSAYPSRLRKNMEMDELIDKKQRMRRRITRVLKSTKAQNVIISGEGICRMNSEGLKKVHNFFKKWCDQISIVIYIRRPRSRMTSGFQQRTVGGLRVATFDELYPNYRDKIEKFDTLFGRDNVTLSFYDRASLVNGDVVDDFCAKIGLDSAKVAKVADQNSRRTVLQTSLLHFIRMHHHDAIPEKWKSGFYRRYGSYLS